MKRFFFALFFVPFLVNAQGSFTEIMYDLEGSDTGREWVEITNTGNSPVDFSTWRIYEANTNHKLALFSGNASVDAGGYAVIADDPQKFLADWPNFSGTLFDSSFSLHNTGETLILRNDSLADIDTVSYTSEWGAAGDGKSLQKINGTWTGNVPTPGEANIHSSQDSQSQTQNNGESAQTPSLSYGVEPKKTINVEIEKLSGATLAGVPVSFRAQAAGLDGEKIQNARLLWSFGDGGMGEGASVGHTYLYPGDYVIFLEGSSGSYAASDRATITVVSADITIESVGPPSDFFIAVKNKTNYEVSLEGWMIESGGGRFVISGKTFIARGGTVRFHPDTTGLMYNQTVALLSPNGVTASTFTRTDTSVTRSVEMKPVSLTPENFVPSPASLIEKSAAKEDSDAGEEVSIANLPQDVSHAAVAANGSRTTVWIFALLGLLFAGLFGFFLIIKKFPETHAQEEAIKADDFTIIEDK